MRTRTQRISVAISWLLAGEREVHLGVTPNSPTAKIKTILLGGLHGSAWPPACV